MQENTKPWSIPVAILGAGAMIAAAVLLSGFVKTPSGEKIDNPKIDIAEITSADHILGNKDARVVVVEYSDFECPYCKVFHETMHKVVSNYGSQVAWVYRHYPIAELHSRAPKEAEASECAAEQGGNEAFWKYADKVFNITNSNNTLDAAELPRIAQSLGLDMDQFNKCLSTNKYASRIGESVNEALKAGARGTPYSVIIRGDIQEPVNGAMPYDLLKQKLDVLID